MKLQGKIFVSEDYDEKNRYFLSVIFHFLFFICYVVGSHYYSSTTMDLEKTMRLSIQESSVRVDIVEMPKLTIKELKSLSITPDDTSLGNSIKKVTAQEAEEKINLKSDVEFVKKRKKKDFSSLLKSLRKNKKNVKATKSDKKSIKRQQRQESKVDRFDRKFDNKLSGLILAGNRLSKGTKIVGDTTAVSNERLSELGSYISGSVVRKIKMFWKLPSYLASRKTLNCRIKIYISGSGKLLKYEVVKSSGVIAFDKRAIYSIQKASPFGRPRSSISNIISSSPKIFEFSPGEIR